MTKPLIAFWYLWDAALTCLGDYLLKRWSIGHGTGFGVAAFFSYCAMLVSGFVLMKASSDLARLSAVMLMINILVATALGVAHFGEHLTPANWVGLGLGVVAVWLLS